MHLLPSQADVDRMNARATTVELEQLIWSGTSFVMV